MIFHILFTTISVQLILALEENNSFLYEPGYQFQHSQKNDHSFPCGTLDTKSSLDKLSSIPWTATLYRRSEDLIDGTWFGVIISEKLILASVNAIIHSKKFKIYHTDNYAVYTKQHQFGQTEQDISSIQKSNITQIRPFPGYTFDEAGLKCAANNYVLIHLQTPLVFDSELHAVCLPHTNSILNSYKSNTYDDRPTFFSGWEKKDKLTVRYITDLNETECIEAWQQKTNQPYENRTCARLPDDGNQPCVKFERGVTVVKDIYNDGTYFFQGLTNCVSNGYECFKSTTIFTQTLSTTLVTWINANDKCGPYNFTCDSGDCIPLDLRCDKIKNCQDHSDEDPKYCRGLNYCDEVHQFECGIYGHCINKNKECDKVVDCDNGEDENNCHYSEDDNILIIIGVSCGALTVLLGMVILLVIRRIMNPHNLTEKEVNEFLNGAELLFPICTNDGKPVCENKIVDQYIDENSKKDDQETFQNLWRQLKWDETYEISKQFQLFTNKEAILGRGQYGVVYRGVYSQSNNGNYSICRHVAVKTLQDCIDIQHFKAILMELKVLAYIASGKHPNIVEFIAADTSGIRERKLQLIMEFCSNGSLDDYLKKNRNNFFPFLNIPTSEQSENDIKIYTTEKTLTLCHLASWCLHIANAMEYLSSKKIIHGDLATRNILLSHDLTAKVSDFGLSRKLYEYKSHYKHNQDTLLPWRWLSIESLEYLEFHPQSDVWSFGVTAWEIFTLGKTPYGEKEKSWDQHHIDLYTGASKLEQPPLASTGMYECMKACWKFNPKERPTFQQLRMYFESLHVNLENIQLTKQPQPGTFSNRKDYVTISYHD